jgi:K+-transporting ATPase c subunit
MILLHDLTAAFLKLAIVVIVLAFAYPRIVMAIAGALNAGNVSQ